jgi:hypothetical protein
MRVAMGRADGAARGAQPARAQLGVALQQQLETGEAGALASGA